MLKAALCVASVLIGCLSASSATLPVKLPQLTGNSSEHCTRKFTNQEATTSAVSDAIMTVINPKLNDEYGPVCQCGGLGWTQVANIKMSDPSQSCPATWNTYNANGVRGCNRKSTTHTCDSVVFTVNEMYTRVCGQVMAYFRGDPDAFLHSILGSNGIEQSYVDGVSVTYGAPGSRKHIWTFATADYNTGPLSTHSCSCVYSTTPWPHTNKLPSFMGNNYFCELGLGQGASTSIPFPNLLWDGKGCTHPNSCCQFNNPPWFCVSLPEPTDEPIEVRLCLSEGPSNEDLIITDVEIYTR